MQEGRMDEIEKVLADEVYQEKLLHEYRLIYYCCTKHVRNITMSFTANKMDHV